MQSQSPRNQSNQKGFIATASNRLLPANLAAADALVCAVLGPSAEYAKRRETEKLNRVRCSLLFTFTFTFLAHLPTSQHLADTCIIRRAVGILEDGAGARLPSSELKHLH